MICSQQLWSNSILDYEKDKSTVKNIYHKGWIDFNKNGREGHLRRQLRPT